MSQTGRGKEVKRDKKREDRQQNVFLLSSVEKNLIETHRDAGNSLPYYAVSASTEVHTLSLCMLCNRFIKTH